MQLLPRALRLGLAVAGAVAALAVLFAAQAQAVPGAKRLHTNANLDRFLSNVDNFFAFAPFASSTDLRQQWFIEPSGTALRIKSVSNPNLCLRAGASAGSVALVRPCSGTDPRQRWSLNQGALAAQNGLRAAVDLNNINQAIVMSSNLSFPPPPNENWHTHSAPA